MCRMAERSRDAGTDFQIVHKSMDGFACDPGHESGWDNNVRATAEEAMTFGLTGVAHDRFAGMCGRLVGSTD